MRHSSASSRSRSERSLAFSLTELLVVMAVIAVMVGLAVPAMNALRGAGDITRSAYEMVATLEQARAYAMANNTYVFVGFFEEDGALSGSAGTAGTGRVVVAAAASTDGTRVYPASGTLSRLDATADTLRPIMKPIKMNNLDLAELAATDPERPGSVPNEYQVAAADFAKTPSSASGGSLTPNSATFSYPLGASSGSAQYTFQKIIQFDPRGDASKIRDTPPRLMEIGLRVARGNQADTNSANLVAIQLTGIAGDVDLYRPNQRIP